MSRGQRCPVPTAAIPSAVWPLIIWWPRSGKSYLAMRSLYPSHKARHMNRGTRGEPKLTSRHTVSVTVDFYAAIRGLKYGKNRFEAVCLCRVGVNECNCNLGLQTQLQTFKNFEPSWGFEPQTCGLRNRCSTPELRWLAETRATRYSGVGVRQGCFGGPRGALVPRSALAGIFGPFWVSFNPPCGGPGLGRSESEKACGRREGGLKRGRFVTGGAWGAQNRRSPPRRVVVAHRRGGYMWGYSLFRPPWPGKYGVPVFEPLACLFGAPVGGPGFRVTRGSGPNETDLCGAGDRERTDRLTLGVRCMRGGA
jgi:hypothetical protein